MRRFMLLIRRTGEIHNLEIARQRVLQALPCRDPLVASLPGTAVIFFTADNPNWHQIRREINVAIENHGDYLVVEVGDSPLTEGFAGVNDWMEKHAPND